MPAKGAVVAATAAATWAVAAATAATLVAVGTFDMESGAPGNGVAVWNGTAWNALGAGLDVDAVAWAVFASGDLIVVGGTFNATGDGPAVNNVAQWDGVAWSPMGAGLGYGGGGPPGNSTTVSALATYGGQLVAAGEFTHSGATTGLDNVATWDGSAWGPLGAGGLPGKAMALATFNGALVAGGSPYVYRWSGSPGSTWTSLGNTNGIVYAMVVFRSALIVSGSFTRAGGAANVAAKDIAQWNGAAWSALGTGMNNWVSALTVLGADLIAGGYFTSAGGTLAGQLASWNGLHWSQVGPGVGGGGLVNALAVYNDSLVVGGDLLVTGAPDFQHLNCVGLWNGTAMSALGGGLGINCSYVNAFAVPNNAPSAAGRTVPATAHFWPAWLLAGVIVLVSVA